MRFKNSYAAAVAAAVSAVVFSAAFQPAANAAPIVIDSFTNQSSPTTIASSTAALGGVNYLQTPGNGTAGVPTGGLFPNREFNASQVQFFFGAPTSPLQTFSASFNTTTGTSLTMVNAKSTGSVTPANILQGYTNVSYFGSAVDIAALSMDSIRIKKAGSSPGTSEFTGTISIGSGTGSAQYQLTAAQWFSNTTLDIPFSSFTGFLDLTSVNRISVTSSAILDSQTDVVKNQAYSASVTFTEIALVPEPTHMVFVAGIGAGLGAWRLRKLRRSREAAGDATAG
jgi:hypothetical protein